MNLLTNLQKIKGVKAAYIALEGEAPVSTFDVTQNVNLSSAVSLVEQYFLAAQSIDRVYDEIVFTLADGDHLMAYQFDSDALVLLLTEARVNMPMIHMSLKLIVKKLRENPLPVAKTAETATEAHLADAESQPLVSNILAETETPSPVVDHTVETHIETDEPKPQKERPYMIYRGQKIYKDEPETKKAEKKRPRMMYRGQEV